MRIDGRAYRTIWREPDGRVRIIDQTRLPFALEVVTLADEGAAFAAIRDMLVRGAPLIGATAAYGLALALAEDGSDGAMAAARDRLALARPTAVNLAWALDRMVGALRGVPPRARAEAAFAEAARLCDEDVEVCSRIGDHGLRLVRERQAAKGGGRVNILTHCNAGWLATVDWGTALAPIYKAHDAGMDVHVWVDETRPRNQGGSLTAYELGQHGVPHTVIVDNAGGHLMQHGLVDLVFVGTDRTTRSGDVCNKIGTYLKALAAQDTGVPFYVCAPGSSIDFAIDDGLAGIPIEMRSEAEVREVQGLAPDGTITRVAVIPAGSPARNDAFDVTPARLVTALVTERGTIAATARALAAAFPERAG